MRQRRPAVITERRRALLGALGVGCAAVGFRARAATAPLGAASEHLQVLRPRVEPVPAVTLLTMQGEARSLDAALSSAVPLVLNFVFTTCSSSCSLQTAVLAQVQRKLIASGHKLQLASITIDPDNDTPEQLRRFAQRFEIAAGWQFYTGRFDDLLRVQKHFDVYRGSKASHPPVLMLRRHARAPWVRLEGFPDAAEIVALIDALPNAV
jgi:cytochrome oxidase Cu insertion factor (SCO1/SenC/PrrC family)